MFIHILAFNYQLKGLSPERLRFSVASPTLDLSFVFFNESMRSLDLRKIPVYYRFPVG